MNSHKNLTRRQTEIYNFLQEYQHREGIAPTHREIADHFGFKSPKAVTDHLCALERKGCIGRHHGRSRGIKLNAENRQQNVGIVSIPILGHIPAGQPERKFEVRQGTLAVDPVIIGDAAHHRLFTLQINGASMEGRGIHDGDWVVIDSDAKPRENDVVVALIDGESTLKTLAKKEDRFYLKAENPNHPDWTPIEELVIQGVAKAILRRIS